MKPSVHFAAWIPLVVMAAAILLAPSGAARAEKTNSVINHGWRIVWDDASATARHVETGREIKIFQDEKGETEEDGYIDNTMLSVVGTVVSYSSEWYSEGGAHPSYGKSYSTVDLSKVDPAKTDAAGSRNPAADLSELLGKKTVFRQLARDPSVKASISGEFSEIGGEAGPEPKSLGELLKVADGGCRARMGENLLTDFAFLHRLGGRTAVVRIGLTHGCEVMRGEFTELDNLYFRIPDALAEDFERAVRAGSLAYRDFEKASYNCEKAGTAIEFAICDDARLAGLDVAMAARYREVRRKRAGDDRGWVKKRQREWIAERNRNCASGNVDCLAESYETWLAELRKPAWD